MGIYRLLLAAFFLMGIVMLASCGGGSTSAAIQPSPTPTPLPFQNPQLLWAGDAQVSTVHEDNGVNGTAFSEPAVILLADGTGGAFVVWEADVEGQVLVQRIDFNGHRVWSAEVNPAPNSPYMSVAAAALDGAGGIIVAWLDGRAGLCDLTFKGSCDIYAQRIDSTGKALWQLDGVPVVTATENQGTSGIALVSDGTGGAILGWEDARACCTIFAQRIDSTGTPVWAIDGVQVSPDPTVVLGGIGAPPQIVPDGIGGAIVSWWNIQVFPDEQPQTISLQKLNAAGSPMWASTGVTASLQVMSPNPSSERRYYQMVSDGAGGVIIAGNQNIDNATTTERHVVAQRINTSGTSIWASGGVRVSNATGPQAYPVLVSNNGGAIAAWRNCTDITFMNCDIAAQKLDGTGQLLWGPQGIPIVSAPNTQASLSMLADGSGGAFILWNDCRNFSDANACYLNMDIYGQRLNANGQTLWQPDGFPISATNGNQGVPYSIEMITPSYAVAADGQGGFILSWPDGRHNFCFDPNLSSSCELFAQRVKP